MSKSKRSLLFSLVIAVALAGCSQLKKTGEVPGKMDQTNEKLDETKKGMDRTNETLDKTRQAIHDQQLLLPLQEMLKPENWKDLAPVPFKLMPYGKKFAEAVQADELMELFYLWTKEISEVGPDSEMDWQGNSIPRTEADAKELFHEKIAKLTILQVIAGFTPEETVQKILAHEVAGDEEVNSQRYQSTAFAFMAMRARFINDVLVRNSIMAGSLTNLGMVEYAANYIGQLDQIAIDPAASNFKFKISGVIKYKSDAGEAAEYPFEFADELPSGQDAPKAWWDKIKLQLDNLASPITPSSDPDVQATQARRKKVEKVINDRISFWAHQQS